MNRAFNSFMTVTRYTVALLFLMAGAAMIDQFEIASAYLASTGLPGSLLPMFILITIGGALAMIAGFKVRWAALLLALLSIASALLFHFDFTDQTQGALFVRNIAIAVLLLVFAMPCGGFYRSNRD